MSGKTRDRFRQRRNWSRRCAPFCAVLVFPVLVEVSVVGAGRAAAQSPVEATAVQLSSSGNTTRFSADFSGPVKYHVFTLPDPYRVVIDLPNVKFRLPDATGAAGKGVIKAYRYGLFAPGKARIVIDASGPVAVVKTSFVPTGAGGRLSIDLEASDAASFAKQYRSRKKREGARSNVAKSEDTPGRRKRGNKPVVILDPGHGGLDFGAVAGGRTQEKNVVLAFSLALRDALNKTGRYIVLMTRNTDVFVPLHERVRFARRHGGDLFVSLHADVAPAAYSASVRGTTVYTLSDRASDDAARELARRENESDVIAGVEIKAQTNAVANILIDLAQRETNARSGILAVIMLGQVKKRTPLNRDPHRSAGFRVLKAPDVVSILVELGYLSNGHDEKLLNSLTWRASIADAMVRSIDSYFAKKIATSPY